MRAWSHVCEKECMHVCVIVRGALSCMLWVYGELGTFWLSEVRYFMLSWVLILQERGPWQLHNTGTCMYLI